MRLILNLSRKCEGSPKSSSCGGSVSTIEKRGSDSTTSSRDQPVSLHNRADEILANLLCAFVGRHNDPANGDGKADDELPSIDDLLAFSSKGISTVYQNSEDIPQRLEGPALNTSGSRLDPNPRPDDGVGNSQGTRGMRPGSPSLHIKQPPNLYADRPAVLEADESYTPEPVPEAVSVSVDAVDAAADPVSGLSKGPW
jgi:hypothetical protein